MHYDYIIIGGGLAGLYCGFILETTTRATFLLLEESNRFGGRAWNDTFANMSVPAGAGVGRKGPDKLLLQLMKQLNLPIRFFPVQHHYSPRIEPIDIAKCFRKLQQAYSTHPISSTFKAFATRVWGKELYDTFLKYNGYRDMEQEDVYQTLNHYRIQDNFKKWTGFSVDWNTLVQRLCNQIGKEKLRLNQPVRRIQHTPTHIQVRTPNQVYSCTNVIFATPPTVISKLIPQLKGLYSNVGTQPFLRTYVQFDPSSAEIIKRYIHGTTIVSNLFQKIIPMNPEKGVYMIAYSDNRNAISGKRLTRRQIIQKLTLEFDIKEPLRILQHHHYFWKIGTHYYKPMNKPVKKFIQTAQHPLPNIYAIGDWVSLNQGWVEGALESVKNIFI